jgi:hypothetical protein
MPPIKEEGRRKGVRNMQVSAEQARQIARSYAEFADHIRQEGDPVGANYAEWQASGGRHALTHLTRCPRVIAKPPGSSRPTHCDICRLTAPLQPAAASAAARMADSECTTPVPAVAIVTQCCQPFPLPLTDACRCRRSTRCCYGLVR